MRIGSAESAIFFASSLRSRILRSARSRSTECEDPNARSRLFASSSASPTAQSASLESSIARSASKEAPRNRTAPSHRCFGFSLLRFGRAVGASAFRSFALGASASRGAKNARPKRRTESATEAPSAKNRKRDRSEELTAQPNRQ
uniref:Uncharacterized protein n=1 Tax=Pediastrum angulosum TaxID=271408 RepID=A0A2U8GI36_9CHLO|nr:hypothetical protein [Pediastrum angulosum]AWI68249.1 hypothetical protein [Pediastrum angulosum]